MPSTRSKRPNEMFESSLLFRFRIDSKGTPWRYQEPRVRGSVSSRRGARIERRIEDGGRGGRDGVLPAANQERHREDPAAQEEAPGGGRRERQ